MTTIPATARRRWLRFSLRTLLLLVLVVGAALGWLARGVARASQERISVAALTEKGCKFQYHEDYESPWAVRRALQWLGRDEPWNVSWIAADCRDKHFSDAEMADLPRLTYVEIIWLRQTQITDAGLDHAKELAQLKWLEIEGTCVTEAGLAKLRGHSQLRILNLQNTQVTDLGLVHLQGLTALRFLHLRGTRVTAAGVQQLRAALPNCSIGY